jgi:SAM-dependent methyltransferase
MSEVSWSRYLSAFHSQYPGITEDVLARAVSDHGLSPYQWVTAPVPFGARTLDLACGSGPCLRIRPCEPWIGVDRSPDELARARAAGNRNVLEGEATALPFADATFDSVVCSMAIMLIQPLNQALDEVHRVLRPGGMFVVTMPGRRPLGPVDLMRYARLIARLGRRRLYYPNEQVLRRVPASFVSRGFHVEDDLRLRFRFTFDSLADSVLFIRSLYLPDVDETVLVRGEELAARWLNSDMGIPLRRITLRRD